MPLTPNLGHVFNITEFQATGCAGGHTGWFQSLINSIHAIVTLLNLPGIWVPLGGTPGTGRDTGFTTHTQIFVNKDNTILASFLHGPCGTGRNAPWVFTMKTGHENKRYFWQPANKFRAHLDNLAGFGSFGEIFVGLALDFTCMASDTFFNILEQIIFTHSKPPIFDLI